MGKFGGKKPGMKRIPAPTAPGAGGGSGKPLSGWPSSKKDEPESDGSASEELEEFDDDEEEEWSGEGSSGELEDMDGDDDDGAGIEESIQFMQQYLKDPLGAFMAAPDTACDKATADRIYAARAVVAADVDSKLGPKSELADAYRAMELAHLRTMNEKLFQPRGAKAAEEVKALAPEDLAEDGTGLMWAMVLDNVCDSLSQKFPQAPFEFTDMDSDLFNFCTNVTPSYVDDDPFKGLVLTFDFAAENPFFTNTQLRCAFHYVGANLALDRVGIDYAAIVGVTSDTPVQWKPGHKFQRLPDDVIEAADKKSQELMLKAFFVSAKKGTTAEDEAAVKKLMAMFPRPLFSALFDVNTPEAAMAKLRSALVSGKDGEASADHSANGLALVRAGTLELHPWRALAQALNVVVRAPMITATDIEEGGMEMAGGRGGGDGDDEEEESDDDSEASEEDKAPQGGKKKNRAEKAAPPPPQECKQQ
eukprot:CAMPEP_0174850354 /NCGR_PEP_ID=MMETSP1114-20130205/19181_1 /TAXON_ID=312471 /ORGANISM="Neobodo designis, Strain CCAP 1951/1" /LENGTH=475 /DNA_ID=CAMNT_0016084811 /DNA_START=34 /DNA_END=1461 /DNA_ORIENTATION=+